MQCPFAQADAAKPEATPSFWSCQGQALHAEGHTLPPNARGTGEWFDQAVGFQVTLEGA